MRKFSRLIGLTVALVAAPGLTSTAQAAEFTDVIDAADDKDDYDEDTYDPFDIHIEPSFTFETSRAQINREAPCVPFSSRSDYENAQPFQGDLATQNPRVQFAPDRCDETSIVENKEMLYRHQEARLDNTLRVGIYKDLELRFNVPFVFSSRHGLKYANEDPRQGKNVTPARSSVDPRDGDIEANAEAVFNPSDNQKGHLSKLNRFKQHRFFNLDSEFRDISRAGLADPSIGIHWAPFNDKRDDTKATLAIGMDYTMPIAKIRQADNDAVGEGMHKLNWSIRSSKRFDWIDPYFGIDYTLQMPSRNSPIKELKDIDNNNGGQSVTQPPHIGNITVGTEFIPWEVPAEHQQFATHLASTFGYVSEGRDYSPLYEHMVNSQCNGRSTDEIVPEFDSNGDLQNPKDVGCSWIAQRPANVQPQPKYNLTALDSNDTFQTNGIMTVEGYATFAGHLGFYIQPSEYVQLKALTGITHQQEHFLTNARTGSDVDDSAEQSNDGKVDLTGPDAKVERNPAYNSTYDSPGTRFRVSRYNTWRFLFTAAFQF